MSQEVALDILIYQFPNDPAGAPAENQVGSFWINTESGAFFISREYTPDGGALTREWFKEGQISETRFRQFFDVYAPLATAEQLREGTVATRVSITPALLRAAILAISPDALTQTQFNQFLNTVSPLATRAEAEAGTSTARRDFTPERVKQAIQASAILGDSFASIAEGTFRATVNMAAAQDIPISFRNRPLGFGKVPANLTEHIERNGQLVPRTIQIDLHDVRPNGIYFIEIEKTANVRDILRIRLQGAPITDVSFGGVNSEQVQELMNDRLVKVVVLVNRLPDGTTAGVASGLVLPQEFSTQKVFDVLNNTEDAQSFNVLDKLFVLQPIEEGRPTHSNSVNFSKESSDPVTISQDGTENDFIERTFDDRSGSANPNKTVFMLTTEGVVNAYTPQMQMEEGDAGPDLPDISRKTLVLTDQRNRPLQGALFIDTNEPKIILVVRINEFNLDFHFGSSRRVTAMYREIPGAVPGRIAGGFLKMRGESGYTESGVYIFNILAPDRDDIFPNAGTVNGMRLKITSLPSLLPSGEYTGHLNSFLADLSFTNVVVGQEIKALRYEQFEEHIDSKIDSNVTAVENRLQGEINTNKEEIESLQSSVEEIQQSTFDMLLTGPASLNEVPAVGASFTITMLIQGAAHRPSTGTPRFVAIIDGQPLTVVQEALTDTTTSISLQVSIPRTGIDGQTTRNNVLRNARDGGLNLQVTYGGTPSSILHVPIRATEEVKYIDIPTFRENFVQSEIKPMASFTGLTIGMEYDITIDVQVADHDNRDGFSIIVATQEASPTSDANKYYVEDYARSGNASEETFSFLLIAKATTLVILGERTPGGDITFGVTLDGLIIQRVGIPTRIGGTNFSA